MQWCCQFIAFYNINGTVKIGNCPYYYDHGLDLTFLKMYIIANLSLGAWI